MENVYENSIISASLPIEISFNPSKRVGTSSPYFYIGKTFTIVSNNNQSHMLKLTTGNFVGFGVSGTTLTFNGSYSNVTFLVENTTSVIILSLTGVSIS